MTPRLSVSTLAALSAAGGGSRDVLLPAMDPVELGTGIVHLGLGAFHRAHQAVITEDAAAVSGDTRWGIHGVTQRSARVVDQLAPQDFLYGVLGLGQDAGGDETASLRLIGSVRAASFPGRDTPAILAAIAAETTHIVSLTVTEKGYRRTAAGTPDLADPDLAADLQALSAERGSAERGSAERESASAAPAAARSPIGLLVRGLAARARDHGAPITVVCCDNLTDNGAQLQRLVTTVLQSTPGCDALLEWVEGHVAFPSTMVDRIVPATTEHHRAQAERLLGLRDEALVVAEPFLQWVIEDRFAGPRPPWELAGATLAPDVAPYERAKLRVLNATHSTLAYAGALHGYATIAEAVADPELLALARALVDEDVVPTLSGDDVLDLAAYRDDVLVRFANPAIGHTTVQVAMDGSQKLPIRLLGTVRDSRAAGAVPVAAAHAVAAWVHYVRATTRGELVVAGRQVALDDPMAAELAGAAAGPLDEATDALLSLTSIFGDDLSQDDAWRAAVRAAASTFTPARVAR